MIKGIYARFKWVQGLFNGTTGHTHDGTNGNGPATVFPIGGAIIMGSETIDGSYKFVVDGDGFKLKKRVDGNWVTWATWDP